jgi:hypothetical protein
MGRWEVPKIEILENMCLDVDVEMTLPGDNTCSLNTHSGVVKHHPQYSNMTALKYLCFGPDIKP